MSEISTLFRQLMLGVHVVSVADAQRRGGFTAAWVMQVSFDPLLLAVSINPAKASYALLHSGGGFAVNVLKQGQLDLARRFGTWSGSDRDQFAGVVWRPGRSGAPILEEALAYFECELAGTMPAGDHELVLGRVLNGQLLARDSRPMLYAETGEMDGSSALYPATW
jgi:flavin reductase (DIM6/NTAB) family NADH-FMN oxidoreductase RutF